MDCDGWFGQGISTEYCRCLHVHVEAAYAWSMNQQYFKSIHYLYKMQKILLTSMSLWNYHHYIGANSQICPSGGDNGTKQEVAYFSATVAQRAKQVIIFTVGKYGTSFRTPVQICPMLLKNDVEQGKNLYLSNHCM